jgi:hypothetical protein
MGLRRSAGLLVLLTMANLAFAGSHLVCERHSGGHHAAAESTMPATDHHDGTTSDKDPGNVPARADCCQAVTSCAPGLSLAVVVASFEAVPDRSPLPRSIDEVPLTHLIPPDPPPPKVQASQLDM